MKEQRLQFKIIQYLRSVGAYVVKVNLATKNGVPDILCCVGGRFVGIEVKARGQPTELQRINLDQIKRAGGISLVAYSVQDVERVIEQIRGVING